MISKERRELKSLSDFTGLFLMVDDMCLYFATSCFFSYHYRSSQQWRLGLWERSRVFLMNLVDDVFLFVFFFSFMYV